MRRNLIKIKMHKRHKCPICDNKKILSIFRYQDTPLEDNFVTLSQKKNSQKVYPLNQMLCRICGHVFLEHVVSQNENYLYYLYNTEITLGLKKHFDKYAKDLIKEHNIKPKSFCIDIGSNDGSMLSSFKKLNMEILGIEPCYSISKIANSKGLNTFNSFFDKSVAQKILTKYRAADVITLNYMYANVDNILKFTENLKSLLSRDGIIVIETGYHPMQMKNNMFDYVYHEHFSYFTLTNLEFIFKKIGLEIIDVKKVSPKGGSIRVFVQHLGSNRKQNSNVFKMINYEKKIGVKKIKLYKDFYNKIEKIKKNLIKKLIYLKQKGKKIVGFGASHSTTVMIYHFKLKKFLEYLVDDNKKKHNLFSPGYHLPVYPTTKVYKDENIDGLLVLAWQHGQAIVKKHFKILKQKKFIILPLPKFKKL